MVMRKAVILKQSLKRHFILYTGVFSLKAGPSGFEPETAGFLSILVVKSPVLYLAELRALR
jgi:hypothetical protein